MAVAIVLGVIVGVVGFLPLLGSLKLSRTVTDTSNFSYLTSALVGVFGSIVILAAPFAVCAFMFRPYVLPYGVAEAAGLVVAVIVFAVAKITRR